MEKPLNIPTNGKPAPHRIPVGICLPGERFSSAWVSNWTNLLVALMASGYDPAPLFGYSSNVFVTRASLWLEMTRATVPIEYVLWVDDDNIITPEMFLKLMKDLQEHPEADMVAGWCWIEPNEANGVTARPSCGRLKPGYVVDPFDWGELKKAAREDRLLECHYTGFPVVLMRRTVIQKAGVNPFTPLLAENMRWGMCGEDIGFCVHARERGSALILVDPKVKVPHFKTAPIPDPVDQFETVDLAHPAVGHKRRFRLPGERPAFSLLHATIRPDGWQKACREWFDLADDPGDCEYLLVTESPIEIQRSLVPWKHFKQVDNEGRHSSTSAWNAAGRVSRGLLLITVADDFVPCPHWDTELLKVIPDLNGQFVVEPEMGANPLLGHSFLTRAYYERYGRVLYPEYWGMYPDDDFGDVARRDGVVIVARHLVFRHLHPAHGTGHWDRAYAWENRPEAHRHGEEVYAWRRANDYRDRVKGDGLEPQQNPLGLELWPRKIESEVMSAP